MFICFGKDAYATEPEVGDACAVNGAFARVGGPEVDGRVNFMVCEGGVWVNYLEFYSGGITPVLTDDATACSVSIEGRVRYDSVNKVVEFCNGTSWTTPTGTIQTPIECSDDLSIECLLEATRANDDPNLDPADIVSGVNILGVTGTLETVLPDCTDDTVAACQLEATRANDDPEFIPENIVKDINVLNVVGTYDRHALRWPEGSSISASDAASSDRFASDIFIDNKVLLAGAPFEDGSGSDQGAVYAYFLNNSGVWSEMQKLNATDAQNDNEFGQSVSVDSFTAIIGAPSEDGAGTDRGAAYLWHRSIATGSWSQLQKLTASDTANGDGFGASVDIHGNSAIVGAPFADASGADSGSSYLFYRDNTSGVWSQQSILTPSDGASGDNFGHDVSMYGSQLAVAAHLDGSSQGAVYIFDRDISNSWSQLIKLTASDGASGDQFGFSIYMSGDTLAVGAPLEDGAGTDRGAVYIFQRDGTWSQVAKIIPEDPSDGDQFGYDVTLRGDTIIIGAPYHDNGGTDRGKGYIYDRLNSGSWEFVRNLNPASPINSESIGLSTALHDHFGFLGSELHDGGSSEEGRIIEFVDDYY